MSFLKKQKNHFGGTLIKGNPRRKRPLSSKKPIHLVLKSSKAKGEYSFLNRKFEKRILSTIHLFAKRYGIKIYRYNNVGNHIHLVIKLESLKSYAPFIRSITGKIAQGIINKGLKLKNNESFWDYRPFSRVISWGRDFFRISDYSLKNTLDVLGLKRTEENLRWLKDSVRSIRAGPEHS